MSHLRDNGLDYRLVATSRAGDCRRNVFLTKTGHRLEAEE